MPNERNAGKKPKYRKNVELVRIQTKVPKIVKHEVMDSIEKIVNPYLFVKKQTNLKETLPKTETSIKQVN